MSPPRSCSLAVRAGLFAALFVVVFAARPARAQDVECDPGDVEVRSLHFDGNRAISDLALSEAVVTTPSSYARRMLFGVFRFLGAKRCLDRSEFPVDLIRLKLLYFQRGFPKAVVDTVVRPHGTKVDVTFRITEGPPLRLTSIAITGLDSVPDPGRITRDLPLRVGGPFDKYALLRTIDTVQTRLRNVGYPTAEVLKSFTTDTAGLKASVELNIVPRARANIGTVEVAITPHDGASSPKIPEAAARRLLGVRTGNLYSERELVEAKRRLYQSDAYVQADIATDSLQPGDTIVNLKVTLTENYMYSARTGIGYGTVDCGRAQGSFTDRHFMHGAARLELSGQLSKLGVAEPTNVSRQFGSRLDPCSIARDDTNSTKLNYYVGATFRTPALWRLRTVPVVTLYRERRSEYLAYLRTTLIGGIVSINSERYPRMPISTAYEMRYGRTEAAPALFCAVFNRCDPVERQDLLELRRLGVLSWTITRNHADNLLSPGRGSVLRFEYRHASPMVLSDKELQFNKLLGDASRYWPAGRGIVAARIRLGAVFGRDFGSISDFVPQEERLYAGGPTTVRGYRQNELGPVVYRAGPRDTVRVVDPSGEEYLEVRDTIKPRAVPTGGNSIVVANLEYRFPSPFLPELFQLTTFIDVGEVWNRGQKSLNLNFSSLKVTPGTGVRVFSPVGAIRLDIGYNTSPLPTGPIYLETPLESGGALLCVSPGNRMPVTGSPPRQDQSLPCPPSFQPGKKTRFLERLAYQISIGQAF